PLCCIENQLASLMMRARKPPEPVAKPQIERCREAARELGCDEYEEKFWEEVVRVARYKPMRDPAKTESE
ncbi:hypothetical protein, partial [Acidisphaera sp. S103]|uniref:hypothetical protein n=1 Tax=Acidisphaera sp. S103 TaxID=1747223 RepID=UPI001C207B57